MACDPTGRAGRAWKACKNFAFPHVLPRPRHPVLRLQLRICMGLLWMTHDMQQSLSSHHLICEQHPEGLHSSAPSSLLLVATPAARPLHVHRRSGWSHLRLGRCPRMISTGTHTLWSRILVPLCRRNSPNLFQQFCPLPRNTGSRCASGASFIRGRCHRALSPYQNAPLLPQSETLEI